MDRGVWGMTCALLGRRAGAASGQAGAAARKGGKGRPSVVGSIDRSGWSSLMLSMNAVNGGPHAGVVWCTVVTAPAGMMRRGGEDWWVASPLVLVLLHCGGPGAAKDHAVLDGVRKNVSVDGTGHIYDANVPVPVRGALRPLVWQ